MANDNPPREVVLFGSNWVRLIFLYFIVLLAGIIYIIDAPTLKEFIEKERVINANLIGSKGESTAWKNSFDRPIINTMFKYIIDDISKEDLCSPKEMQDYFGRKICNVTYNLNYYGTMIDYRLYILLYTSPIILIFIIPFIIDALMIRKISLYKSSFSSPLKHNLGAKLLMMPSTIIIIILILTPMTMPVLITIFLILTKAIGWWVWISNLPKRI